jgi:glycosyltransferase involved in cell wall biosynthesis
MLRVLTLTTLFPNALKPTFGVFVERQTLGIAHLPETEVQAVLPVGMPPWPLSTLSRYAALATLPQEEDWKGIKVYRPRFPVVPRFGARWSARWMADAVLPLMREIRKRFPFDVIDAEFFWPDGPAAMHLSRALGVPFSVIARGSDIQYWMKRPEAAGQILEAARSAGGMLAASEALRQVMIGYGFPAERIRTHYTGVDRTRFHVRDRAEEKAKLGISGPLIATVGALIPGKGQKDAIAAAQLLPNTTLLLAGEGPDRASLEKLIRRKGLQDRVRLLGNRPVDEVAALVGAADVLVLPSRSEGLANVWVEALVSGTPVVTSDVGGVREVIDRPEAGEIVPPEPEAIAAAVRRILADPPDQQLVHRCADKFNSEVKFARMRAHLADIVERAR